MSESKTTTLRQLQCWHYIYLTWQENNWLHDFTHKIFRLYLPLPLVPELQE